MTLKEKFKNIVCNIEISNEKLINKSEKIADDYAIEFAEWFLVCYIENNDQIASTKQLLEIFKKEKGL
jgi:hypothetical protein